MIHTKRSQFLDYFAQPEQLIKITGKGKENKLPISHPNTSNVRNYFVSAMETLDPRGKARGRVTARHIEAGRP